MYPTSDIEPPSRPVWDKKEFDYVCKVNGKTYKQVIETIEKTFGVYGFYTQHSEICHNIIEGMISHKYEFDSDFDVTIFKTNTGYEVSLKNLARKLSHQFITSCFDYWTTNCESQKYIKIEQYIQYPI